MPSDIHLFRDSSAVVRYLMWEGGSEHQFVRTGYYYDEDRKLRFAFREQNTEYGTRFEERVYYGNDGQVVRRLRKLVRGPSYGSDKVEPAHDPMEWIRRFCEN